MKHDARALTISRKVGPTKEVSRLHSYIMAYIRGFARDVEVITQSALGCIGSFNYEKIATIQY